MSNAKKQRVVFIGSGGIAERHITALRAIGDVDVVGVAARSLEAASGFATRHAVKPFGDYRSMLDETKPDAAFLCVTPGAHGEIERAVIERRVPFFVEKPLAIDWETAASLAKEVERAGLVTGVGYHFRYLSTAEQAKEILGSRHVGLALGYWLTPAAASS